MLIILSDIAVLTPISVRYAEICVVNASAETSKVSLYDEVPLICVSSTFVAPAVIIITTGRKRTILKNVLPLKD